MVVFWRVIGHIAIFILVVIVGFFLCLAVFGEIGTLVLGLWLSAPLIFFNDGSSLPVASTASLLLSLIAAAAAVIWRLRLPSHRPLWIGLGLCAAVLFGAFGYRLDDLYGSPFGGGATTSADVRGSQAVADIGSTDGDDIIAKRISADGSTVIGVSQDQYHQKIRAFRWTQSGGLQFLKFPDEDKTRPHADASGVSANGQVIVGRYFDARGALHVYRWTAASGVADVAAPGDWRHSLDPTVSNDGAAIAGTFLSGSAYESHLYVWTAARGFEDLGAVARGVVPVAVSNDGSVISGSLRKEGGDGIFQWTRAAGFQNLGTIGKAGCQVVAASTDGSVIVGYSWDKVVMIEGIPDTNSFNGGDVFRWTRATGIQKLGTMGGAKAMPQGVSADGTTILGARTDNKHGWRAFLWSEAGGVREVGAQNWHDSSATDISSDGSKILGHYNDIDLDIDNVINPADKREHFFVMPPILVAGAPSQPGAGGGQAVPGEAGLPAAGSEKAKFYAVTLALVADDPGNSAMSPLFDASGSGQTYIQKRDLTKLGEIESVTAAIDETGMSVLKVHLTDAARNRVAADTGVIDQEVALELESGAVLAVATVRAPLGGDFVISGLKQSDVTRILGAISSGLSANRIPDLPTAPKWTILDLSSKFLSKSVFVSKKTGIIHLKYCSFEPCEPDAQVVDVQPATVDCRTETFRWTNFMEVAVADSLQGKHAVARNSGYGVLIQGLCAQRASLPAR